MGDPVVRFEIMGGDGEAMGRFYGELFGWRFETVESSGGGYRLAQTDAARGIDGGIGSFPGVPSYVTVYVEVQDLDASVERARALGATVVAPPREVAPGTRTAVFTDPDGHLVGMIAA